MSKSYRDIPSGPNRHQQMHEELKRQQIIERARQESEVIRKEEHERAEKNARSMALFCLWTMCDNRLYELEQQRDEHSPKHMDDPWDEQFCDAVRLIPELKQLCQDLWFSYCNIDRPEFSEYM